MSQVYEGRSAVVHDPVCGMSFPPEKAAATLDVAGETIHFCSLGCKEKLEADPARYLDGAAGPPGRPRQAAAPARAAAAASTYTCPMHPEVQQAGPGDCPKCGMALEPSGVPAPATRTAWTCPMHPEIVRDAPGSCPICGMALEPRTVQAEEEANPELVDMTRRYWVSAALTLPLVLLTMGHFLPGDWLARLMASRVAPWLELALATPVVLWGGWPFFVRGYYS
ncbi:MAG TPA: heavy metal-binding domain-containing protein, partial [Candidatus Binatia bacterium]|nr:heavy metal-binding domain-containing protein [Candidatus Binatia bacterium]